MLHRLIVSTLALLLSGMALAADTSAPPTPVRPVSDNYHGTVVQDPYRWMEDMAAPEFQDWLKVQADHAHTVLSRISARDALRKRLAELSESSESVQWLQRVGDTLVYLKSEPGRDQRRLFLREGVNGAERLLLDPMQVPGQSGQHSIDFFTLSPNKQWLALGLSSGGNEASELRVMRVADASLLPDRIDRAGLNEVISWLPDSRRFFYNRLPAPGAKGAAERYTKSAVYLHTLGQPVARDTAVFGWQLSLQRRFAVADLPTLFTQTGSPWVLAEVAHGDAVERSYYVVQQKNLRGPATPWRRIIAPADAVKQARLSGQQVFALSHRKASRRELLRLDLPKPGFKLVLPARERVLRSLDVSRDAVYVEALDGGVSRVVRVPLAGGDATALALPVEGLVREIATRSTDDQVWLRMESWARPAQWFDAASAAELALQKPPAAPPIEITAQRVMVRSHDGVMVPLSILHKKGLVLDGARPTILSGYGAYGISMEPRYNPQRVAWLERGGVIAVAHVRGGGEFGEDWHRAGWILTKQNTVSDFVACAQYLIDQRYTQSAKLAGTGGSAGGLTIGGAITQRPELFAAAQSAVGLSDLLRAELTPNGPPNIAEFGTVTNPQHFKAMYALSPFHRVRDGVNYPGVIVTTGANDPRVDAWEPAKMAARLQAATASGKPVLLRVDFAGGHGVGSGRSQWVSQTADVWSFFLWQMGEPEFQPQ